MNFMKERNFIEGNFSNTHTHTHTHDEELTKSGEIKVGNCRNYLNL